MDAKGGHNLLLWVLDFADGRALATRFGAFDFAMFFGMGVDVGVRGRTWGGHLASSDERVGLRSSAAGVAAVGGIWATSFASSSSKSNSSLRPNSLRQNPDMAFPSVKMGNTHALLTGN
jgi:hypothetical protein